jgi:membrane-bound lytic murein transglycosylase D
MSGLHPRCLLLTLLAVVFLVPPSLATAATEGADEAAIQDEPKPTRRPLAIRPLPAPNRGRAGKKKVEGEIRLDLLERIRCEGEDATTCFVESDWSPDREADVFGEPTDVDALLREILDGLEGHDGQLVQQGEAELEAATATAQGYFGADDHLMHPSTDLYADPVKAMSGRPNLYLDLIDPDDFDYPIVLNSRVQDWMVYLLTRGRRWYVKWLARSERYRPLIVPMLQEAGLPEDLLYQAMIESGFNPYATSHASAVGVWQFISSTGRSYGLQRNWWVDERRDPVQATGAAIAFMSDLYARFGSWELSSAAYNAGGGKIGRAIKMYGTEDYWELSASQNSYLKPETKNYVPKIMAAAILAKYADRYGLTEEIKEEDRLSAWDFDVVTVPEATDLRVVADLVEMEVEDLVSINPALRREYTPPGITNYRLNVPKGLGEPFAEAFAKIPEAERVTFVRYKIRGGDTLGRVAKKYGVPVATIQRMNGIRDPRKLRVGQWLTIPVRADNLGDRTITHVVDRGETLSGIASTYGMKTGELRDLNGLKEDTLQVGQRLKVVSKGSGAPVAAAAAPASSGSSASSGGASGRATSGGPTTTWHTVRSGDSLSRIASKHGTTIPELSRLNGFSGRHVLHPGDKVRLRPDPPSDPTTSYVVRAGDTLSGIADRYGMSTSELSRINSLTTDRIRVGQKLKVVVSGRGGSPVEHTVASGDTLSQLAEKYAVSVDALQRWNGVSGTSIRVGQKLTIYPGQSSASSTPSERTIDYQVQSGDTLGRISRKYGVSVSDLMAWNGLDDHVIRPGQRLRVILR